MSWLFIRLMLCKDDAALLCRQLEIVQHVGRLKEFQ